MSNEPTKQLSNPVDSMGWLENLRVMAECERGNAENEGYAGNVVKQEWHKGKAAGLSCAAAMIANSTMG